MKKNYSLAFLLLLVVFIISLSLGQRMITLPDWLSLIIGKASRSLTLTFWNFRLPRSLVALLSGAGLALSGYLLQGVTRNELADASFLGINSGAGLFVMLYLGLFAQGSPFLLPVIAVVGGLISAILVYFIAFASRVNGLSMNKLLLSGIAVNAGMGALTLLLTIKIAKESYQFVMSWLAGSIWGVTWEHAVILFVWISFLGVLGWWRQPILRLLSLGRENALSLGVAVDREQTYLLAIAAMLASVSVAFSGNLAFLGLLAPHIAKALSRNFSYSMTALCGGIIVLLADTLGRMLLTNGEVPAGILIAIIGAPYFLVILLRRNF
ncbi:iron ABC transporter permease [Enterococcus asini]|uniref:FecCD family ABC transporter permease n=1 Tax=Enterococcus asini TaxID=57732 RepID=UPI002890169B|nr:iron ABC transporter permease [Enterococcus asini]MDT2756769.1 iron ABC transporter permease [Enterococcus asini]